MAHIVKMKGDLVYRAPAEFEGRSAGYTVDPVVDEAGGSVQMGFRLAPARRRWRRRRPRALVRGVDLHHRGTADHR